MSKGTSRSMGLRGASGSAGQEGAAGAERGVGEDSNMKAKNQVFTLALNRNPKPEDPKP